MRCVELDAANFVDDSSDLSPEQTQQLGRVVTAMNDDPALTVHVVGNTDLGGNPTLSFVVSQRRADAVINYLVAQGGIDASRLTSEPGGQSNPISTAPTARGRRPEQPHRPGVLRSAGRLSRATSPPGSAGCAQRVGTSCVPGGRSTMSITCTVAFAVWMSAQVIVAAPVVERHEPVGPLREHDLAALGSGDRPGGEEFGRAPRLPDDDVVREDVGQQRRCWRGSHRDRRSGSPRTPGCSVRTR